MSIPKHAFFTGFLKRRHEKKLEQGRQGFHSSLYQVHSYAPLPKQQIAKWQQGLENKTSHAQGWNHFSDQFNSWLQTPEGIKWNEAQAKRNRK